MFIHYFVNSKLVWDPLYLQGSIKQTESVQRKFTKRLYGLTKISYKGRLTLLQIDSLVAGRLRFDLIMAYSIVFNMVDVSAPQFLLDPAPIIILADNATSLFLIIHVDVWKYFFQRA